MKIAPWVLAYPNLTEIESGQYHLMLNASTVNNIQISCDDTLVDTKSTPDKYCFMLDLANVDTSSILYDDHDQISIDQITSNTARLRPLSYRHHVRFYKSLDVQNTVKMGMSAENNNISERNLDTLRNQLSKAGLPHEPNSDIAPCKFGISCLILEKNEEMNTRALITIRSKKMTYYPNTRHSSFSGGVEIQDIQNNDLSLSGVLKNAASRECKEELGLDIDNNQINILGIWRDLERCSAQAFAYIFVEELDQLTIQINREVASFRYEKIRKHFFERLFQRHDNTPELNFLLSKLPITLEK
ncbi:hypothetical protein [Lentilitoribacter sp. EG35]|uniref:hypothetical protein n=1 Tax=Lentilitoribacter sp. EG35 TaxID=3234192 RepID=UPI003460A192